MASFLHDASLFSSSVQHKSCSTLCPLSIDTKIMNFLRSSTTFRRGKVAMVELIYGSDQRSHFHDKPNPNLVIIAYRPILFQISPKFLLYTSVISIFQLKVLYGALLHKASLILLFPTTLALSFVILSSDQNISQSSEACL